MRYREPGEDGKDYIYEVRNINKRLHCDCEEFRKSNVTKLGTCRHIRQCVNDLEYVPEEFQLEIKVPSNAESQEKWYIYAIKDRVTREERYEHEFIIRNFDYVNANFLIEQVNGLYKRVS